MEQEDHFGNYTYNMIGFEDCLYLNVYSTQSKEALPVLFWIHGGGFTAGAGDWYRPDYLLDFDLVVVSINYRLGALGFLSLDSPTLSGNQGLRDQALALEWVQNNIAARLEKNKKTQHGPRHRLGHDPHQEGAKTL